MTGVIGAALPIIPLLCALVGLLLPRSARRAAAGLGIAGAAAALVLAIVLAARVHGLVETSHRWVDLGYLPVTVGVRLNPAAAYVAVAVGLVALAVQVYSTSYLRDDDRYPPYAAQVSLFTAAMLVVVVSGDLVMLLIGWEVMGICSYLLIGHDRRLPEAPAAAVKAFLVTRVGDVGFLLGIALLGIRAGSFRIADVLAQGVLSPTVTTVVCLLLLAGVVGKSAQFPLHTWLPDAMAGPTPISALIHAATMVAAGIYVVTRLYPLFLASPVALNVIAGIAVVTMLLGALAATAQDDIKRVLAWSTVSQIAYMTGALAVGSPAAALFHLLTHAAFKALLFLGAGSVIHAVGSNLMSRMGGLRRTMPVTFWCMTIGLAALIGLPPLAGFWSKDEILHVAVTGSGWRNVLVYGAGLATVVITAAYATRLWLRTFFGPPRSEEAAHAHEPPASMAWPVLVLAVPSALLGFVAIVPSFGRALGAPDGFTVSIDAVVPLVWSILAVGFVWWLWRRRAEDPVRVLGPLGPVFANAFYLDALQDLVVVRPAQALARSVRRADESGVDGAVEAAGRGTVRLGGLVAVLHRGSLPSAAAAVLGGALVLGLAALAIVGGVAVIALILTLAVPAVGALATLAVPARADRAGRVVAAVAAGVAFVASALLLFWRGSGTIWTQVDLPWVPGLDLRFHLGVDGLSYPLVVLTTLLTLLCALYTCWRVPGPPGRGRQLAALLLVLEVGILGVFLALDLVLFFVFFEVVLLPMYAVIAVWGGERRRAAARKFVLYTLLGSVLLLVGVFTVVAAAGTADIVALSTTATMSRGTQLAAFILFALAFAVKSPLWPLHSWLPDAHTEAPTVGSVILAGVLLKMGTYGLLRVAVGVAPQGAEAVSPYLGVLAVAAIGVGGLVCLAQTDLKRLIAYSSVGHMGFVLLGIATLTPIGFQAAVIGNIAHGVITGLLFFLVGAVKDRAHTGELGELGGLREVAPGLSGLLAYAAIASLGLPGLAGFWGEAAAVFAAISRGGPFWILLGGLAAVGAALAAAYFLRMLRRVTHGPPSPVVRSLSSPGLGAAELVSWGPLVALALVLGLVPALVTALSLAPVLNLVVVP